MGMYNGTKLLTPCLHTFSAALDNCSFCAQKSLPAVYFNADFDAKQTDMGLNGSLMSTKGLNTFSQRYIQHNQL